MPKIARGGQRGRPERQESRRVSANLERDVRRIPAQNVSFTEQYRRYRRRRLLSAALITLGSVVVVTHVFVHLGNVQWLPIVGLQDLLTGYPMGGVLIVFGLMALPRQ